MNPTRHGDHVAHDPLEIVAYAADDLRGADRAAAERRVATCPECARLAEDLHLVAAATRAIPTPDRRRDFRLTEADARRLRPGGWRRLIAAFGAPRFAPVAPLGVAMTALGLVGVLVGPVGLPAGLGDLWSGAGASRSVTTAAGSGESVAAPDGASGSPMAPVMSGSDAYAYGSASPGTLGSGDAKGSGAVPAVGPTTGVGTLLVLIPSTLLILAGLLLVVFRALGLRSRRV